MNTQPREHAAVTARALFGDMSHERGEFLRHCRKRARVMASGTELVGQGQDSPGAVWVLSGRVALHKTMDDGRRILFDLLLPIDVVHPATADMCTSTFEATAEATSVVAFFSHEEVNRLQSTTAGLAAIVSLLDAAAQARQSERMLRIVEGRAEESVAFLVLELALRTNAQAVLAHRHCSVELSQRAIGEMTGLSSVHVCRVMRRLTDRAVLRSVRGATEVCDVPALAELAHADPEALAHAILI